MREKCFVLHNVCDVNYYSLAAKRNTACSPTAFMYFSNGKTTCGVNYTRGKSMMSGKPLEKKTSFCEKYRARRGSSASLGEGVNCSLYHLVKFTAYCLC